MSARQLFAAAALSLCTTTLSAQNVGSMPEQSPFRDVEKRQAFAILAGPVFGGKDAAGAAPRGGMAVGFRYDIPLGSSPIAFTSTLMRQSSKRDVLQPGQPLANRIGATVSEPLWMLDAAFTLLLTGNRSWRSFVPGVTLGAGLVAGGSSVTDSSNFKFGTRFAPSGGLSLKYAPVRSRWTVRADLTSRLYSVPFPQSFRDSTPGIPRIVGVNSKNDWVLNTMLTLGLVREIGRR
ncbi:MAG: hypothetical protein V4813_05025 [Gemmatimonadota bacterium]